MAQATRLTSGRLLLVTRDAIATGGVLMAVERLLLNMGGIQQVGIGVPEAGQTRVSVNLLIGGGTITDREVLRRTVHVAVLFYYRVDRAERDAELRMADLVDRFIVAFYNAREGGLYGSLHDAALDLTPADSPDYQEMVGPEYRVYPVVVLGTQRHALS